MLPMKILGPFDHKTVQSIFVRTGLIHNIQSTRKQPFVEFY